MSDFNEAKTLLNLENVQTWARTKFPEAFTALPKVSRVTFLDIAETSYNRSVQRSLGRSTHNKLLIIGEYAPGSEDPDSGVGAHVHSDNAEVSFYRIDEPAGGKMELHLVKSTSTVAFFAPFCDVGDDMGGSKAICRVSAIIQYYFLAAGFVNHLERHKQAPKMFTKNFEDACRWIKNGGERPTPALSSSSRATTVRRESGGSIETIVHEVASTPISVTVTEVRANVPVKRERKDDTADDLPKAKRPARARNATVCSPAQVILSSVETSEVGIIQLREEIASLISEKADLQSRLKHEGHAYRGLEQELEQAQEEATETKAQLAEAETLAREYQKEAKKWKAKAARAEKEAAIAKNELEMLRNSLTKDLGQVLKSYGLQE